MAESDNKKQRHDQKRREKKAAQRRAEQGSGFYHRIGTAGEASACYINRDWRQEGMITLHVLCKVPGGGHAAASFLIDAWALGLKDAFGHLAITREEFEDHFAGVMGGQIVMVPTDIATARRLVAGAIRWAHDHGFRLPPRYERWVALLGDIGDWHTADVSDFGVEGKLRFIGDEEDLRRRLVGSTVEEFMARDDVEILAMRPATLDADLLEHEEATNAFEQMAEDFHQRVLNAVRQWCFATGLVPHPRLPDAVQILVTSLLEASATTDDAEEAHGDETGFNIERMLALEAESQAELTDALAQVVGFIGTFKAPGGLAGAMGLRPPPEDERKES